MARHSLLDLTGEQAAAIEDAVGAPIDDWGSVAKGRLLPLVLQALEGGELATYQQMSVRALIDSVTFEDTPEGNAEGAS